ncbi:MAG: cobalamin-dependent protein [Treponema sp.]|jgi:methanogenic corrinoid protein MtbC1|nr:cobalamin-dependent protein [Treponema sp.]
MVDLVQIAHTLQDGRAQEASDLIIQALEEDYTVEDILSQGLRAGMISLEQRFRSQAISIPQVLIALRAMHAAMRILKPLLLHSGSGVKGIVVIGTVPGDLHDIPKNLMSIMMESLGLRVIDLGIGVSPERFIEVVKQEPVHIIVCTAELIITMPQLKLLVEAFDAPGIRDQVKIMISGAPVTEQYCRSIGADFYAPDAISAMRLAAAYYQGQL